VSHLHIFNKFLFCCCYFYQSTEEEYIFYTIQGCLALSSASWS